MSLRTRILGLACALGGVLSATGCVHLGPGCSTCGGRGWGRNACDPCGQNACGCDPCGRGCGTRGCEHLGRCYANTSAWLTSKDIALCGAFYQRSNAIPEALPLGSTVGAWYQVMQTNAEASDFIIHQRDFIGQTARLTPDGKDHVWEIAARMRSTPFPVIVERTDNNSDPELDALRRRVIVAVLCDFGNPDADQRTVVSTSYGPGYNAIEAESTYYQHLISGGSGGNNYGTFGNNAGQYGGFGGGGGGGVGFGP
jgi:hypothetical protein